ncbi:Major facilitator superfamily domain protein [Metarhizium robertsii ARSEF 23]|uniref:Major facilitator superfamily domain protein n=1 Tax=Metarhizium robertsii (strain ARSEF 23 / ATCC MYA-3075) TaxID=655844 RepID=E9EJB9_METRA|nr:Major facilitator superfamily domain protein [Metarhizium robertsii ARSEF 23]EFZ04239.1 Major facilitator superfamily domain protein [Metarhizium robertsii ARSEF 23]
MSSTTTIDDKSLDDRSLGPDDDVFRLRPERLSTAESLWVSESLSPVREAVFVAVVCMAQFCTQAAFMGTLVLLRTIGDSFGVSSPPRLAWLVGGYSLTVGTFILFSGRLGDVFGYKRVLLAGLAWFSLWSLVAGLSVYSSYTLAVLSRVLQGIGPAVCLPNALAILGAAYPPGHRKAMAPRTWRGWAETLDLAGALLGVVALVLFNFAWTQAPISGWATPTILVPLVLGLLLLGAFAVVEFRVSRKPLVPFDAVNADVAFVLAAVACGWASFGVWTLYLVQVLQDVRGLSPLLTTAWFLPVVFLGICAAVVTGKLLGPLQVRPPYVMAMALLAFTLGSVLTASTPPDQSYWGQTFVSMLVMPFGMDMSFPAATLILSDAVPKRHQGVGASLVNTVVNYGIALGVGFAGTVEVQVHGHGDTPDDLMRGFRGALYMGVGLAGLGLAVSLWFVARERILKKTG